MPPGSAENVPEVPASLPRDERPGALEPISEYSMAETISNSEASFKGPNTPKGPYRTKFYRILRCSNP